MAMRRCGSPAMRCGPSSSASRGRSRAAIEPDGGPLRYRVVHTAKLWAPGERPQLAQQILEGDPGPLNLRRIRALNAVDWQVLSSGDRARLRPADRNRAWFGSKGPEARVTDRRGSHLHLLGLVTGIAGLLGRSANRSGGGRDAVADDRNRLRTPPELRSQPGCDQPRRSGEHGRHRLPRRERAIGHCDCGRGIVTLLLALEAGASRPARKLDRTM